MAIIVHEYGLLSPKVNAARVEEQFKLAHRYRNVLTEIELKRREAIRKIMASHPEMVPFETELAEVNAEIEKLRSDVNAIRKVERKRSATPEQSKRIKQLVARAKELRAEIRSRRKEVAAAVKPELDAVQLAAVERRKEERKKSGVYWGTYLLQEAAADQARDQPMPPKFTRWDGGGRVSVQIQNGMPADELWGDSQQVQITNRVDPAAYDAERTRRGDRHRMHRTTLRMRIGSEDRRPVWAEWDMYMHRPTPDGAKVKVVTVSRRKRNCAQWWWRVHFTLDVTDCKPKQRPASGVVACNLGFAKADSGAIRAGYLVGDDGWEQEILVAKSDLYRGRDLSPEQQKAAMTYIVDSLAEASEIHGQRDKVLAAFKERFIPWAQHFRDTVGDANLPEWFVDRIVHLDKLRSPGRLRGFYFQWLFHRLKGSIITGTPTPVAATGSFGHVTAVQYDGTNAGLDLIHTFAPWRVRLHDDQGRVRILGTKTLANPGDWFVRRDECEKLTVMAPEAFRATYELRPGGDPETGPDCYQKRIANPDVGDLEGLDMLEAWVEYDEHAEKRESMLRNRALGDRRETYRIIAARLAQRYRTLLIDDTNLKDLQDGPSPEDDAGDIPAHKYQQRLAAGSELRNVLINAFGADNVVKMAPKNMTMTCHTCSTPNRWDRSDGFRRHRCSACGTIWDQDANFGKNLLRAYRQDQAAGGEPQKPKKPSRSQRLHQARDKRRAPQQET